MAKIKDLVEKRIALLADLGKKDAQMKSVKSEIKRIGAELDGLDKLMEENIDN